MQNKNRNYPNEKGRISTSKTKILDAIAATNTVIESKRMAFSTIYDSPTHPTNQYKGVENGDEETVDCPVYDTTTTLMSQYIQKEFVLLN